MSEAIVQHTQERMQKSLDALKGAFAKIRSGRAHPNLLEHVRVSSYGTETLLSQVASITAEDARTLLISAWDKSLIPSIERAILTADLGLNPVTHGTLIRVPLPALTEERRKEMAKLARNDAEEARVSLRNIRRDAMQAVKLSLKEKKTSEDESRRLEERIQKATDAWIVEVDKLLGLKEKELMDI